MSFFSASRRGDRLSAVGNSHSNNSTGAGNKSSASAGVRVVSAGNDPADEVRTTLAALNARAQQLVSDNVDHRVVSNGRSLYEVSRKAVEGTRQQVQRSSAGGDAYAPTSQASVELFMAQHLGFDVQEQQRLLQQLHNSQRQMAADIASTERAGRGSAGPAGVAAGGGAATGAAGGRGMGGALGGGGGGSVDALVARLKGDIIAQAQSEVHQREKELLQRQEYAIFKAAWRPFYVSLADDFETLAMRQADPGKADHRLNGVALAALRAQQQQQQRGTVVGASSLLQGASGLATLLSSGSSVADEINRKVAAFAPIVSTYPPSQWTSHFAAYVRERVVSSGDELAALWVTAERILAAMDAQGSVAAADVLAYVAASRQVMEEKALGRLLTATMRIDPSRVEEAVNMPAERVLDLVTRATGTANVWAHIFEAMRVGRYDVAAAAAKRTGHGAVEAAVQRLADMSPADRVHAAPALELRELYAQACRSASVGRGSSPTAAAVTPGEGHSQPTPHSNSSSSSNGLGDADYDVYRHAVLFLLLAGSTGESVEVTKRTLFCMCSRVGSSIEDVLWMRLFSVRGVDETAAKGGAVQSLSYVQKIILDDLQDLVTMAHGNVQRIASFLVHALLPSSGLRLLLENEVTCVDGLHLALCFNQANVLQCSPLESPVGMAKQIARYCAVVLLDVDQRSLDGVRAGASIFDYFHKTGFDDAFAEFCLKDVVAARLFGQRGILVTPPPLEAEAGMNTQQRLQLDGVLLSGSGPVSPDLMRAMGSAAELAATRNNTPLALHLLLALARACLRTGRRNSHSSSLGGSVDPNAYATSVAALQRAVKLACPALAQAFYMPPHTSHAGALFNVCGQLRAATREAGIEVLSTNLATSTASGAMALVALDPVTGTPQLTRADVVAFDSLCIMADVFLSAHGAYLEQALRGFFSLPFVPRHGATQEMERCVVEFGSSTGSASAPGSSVVAAAGAIVPLAFRLAASQLQVYAQQQQQYRGSATGESASGNAAMLRQGMVLVCEWLRRCGSQAGTGGLGGSAGSGTAGLALYEACAGAIAEFENQYLR